MGMPGHFSVNPQVSALIGMNPWPSSFPPWWGRKADVEIPFRMVALPILVEMSM
jgi:hypothetical protein